MAEGLHGPSYPGSSWRHVRLFEPGASLGALQTDSLMIFPRASIGIIVGEMSL